MAAPARTIHVDANGTGDYPTIQAAIDDANDGDVVVVQPGTYTGDGNRDIDFLGKAITVRSVDPNEAAIVKATLIDCNGTEADPHRGFKISISGEAVLEGLTISNGYAPADFGWLELQPLGGAILCLPRAKLTIKRCTFENNYGDWGGGIFSFESDCLLTDCIFVNNRASSGGGLFNYESNATVIRCTFIDNFVSGSGGGIYNYDCGPKIESCTFIRNRSGAEGGGMSTFGSPTLVDCVFISNSTYACGGGIENFGSITVIRCTFRDNAVRARADAGGGGLFVHNIGGAATIIDSTFVGNSVYGGDGGGMASQMIDGSPVLSGCTFTGNYARDTGGGLYTFWENPIITNCIFTGNLATTGGAISTPITGKYILSLRNCTFMGNSASKGNTLACWYNPPKGGNVDIDSCIIWDSNNWLWNQSGANVRFSHSDVQGPAPGNGNTNVDPLFVLPGYWDPNGTPDSNDDFWIDGDYHLKSEAGRWNSISQNWVQDELTSPCIDAGNPSNPVGREPFPNGGRINMGAYGGTAEASKSYFGEPLCETIMAGDINGDCKVDLADFIIMAFHWLEDGRL